MRLTKAQREQVRAMFDGRCAYCGVELADRWHADHVEAVLRGCAPGGGTLHPENHTVANHMPACARCNISKNVLSLDEWRDWLQGHVRALNAHHTPYQLAKTYGLIQETGAPVIFYFERFSQSGKPDQSPAKHGEA